MNQAIADLKSGFVGASGVDRIAIARRVIGARNQNQEITQELINEVKSYLKNKVHYGWHRGDIMKTRHTKSLINTITLDRDKADEIYNLLKNEQTDSDESIFDKITASNPVNIWEEDKPHIESRKSSGFDISGMQRQKMSGRAINKFNKEITKNIDSNRKSLAVGWYNKLIVAYENGDFNLETKGLSLDASNFIHQYIADNQDTAIIESNLDFKNSTMFFSENDQKLRANFLKYLAKNEGTRHIPNDDFANSVAILMIKNLVKEIEKGGRYSANAIVGNGYYNGHVLEISSREKNINYGIMLRLRETGKSPSNFKIELIVDKSNIFDSVRTLEDLKAIDYTMPIDLDIPYFVKNVLLPIFDKKADVDDENFETSRKRDAIIKAEKDVFIDYFVSIGAIDDPEDREVESFKCTESFKENYFYFQINLNIGNPNTTNCWMYSREVSNFGAESVDKIPPMLDKIDRAKVVFSEMVDYLKSINANVGHSKGLMFLGDIDLPTGIKKIDVSMNTDDLITAAHIDNKSFDNVADLKAYIAKIDIPMPFSHHDSEQSHKDAIKDVVYNKLAETKEFQELKQLIDSSVLVKLGKIKGQKLIDTYDFDSYLKWNYTTRGIIESRGKQNTMNALSWNMYKAAGIEVDTGHHIEWFKERVKDFLSKSGVLILDSILDDTTTMQASIQTLKSQFPANNGMGKIALARQILKARYGTNKAINLSGYYFKTSKGIQGFQSQKAYGIINPNGQALSKDGESPMTTPTMASAKEQAKYANGFKGYSWINIYNSIEEAKQGKNNAPNTNEILERNSQTPRNTNSGNEKPVRNDGSANGTNASTPSATANQAGNQQQGDNRVPTDSPVIAGTQSDSSVVKGNWDYSPARTVDDTGSGDVSGSGISDDRQRNETVAGIAQGTKKLDRAVKLALQAQAEGIDYEPTKENIRATLPFLLPEQQDDIVKIEARFKDNHGMLITNGTGTGKTFTALGAVKRFQKQGKDSILIVVPNDKIGQDFIDSAVNMKLTIKLLDGIKDNGGSGISITTYANFYQNESLLEREFDLVVFDESHKINSNAAGDDTKVQDMMRSVTGHPSKIGLKIDKELQKDPLKSVFDPLKKELDALYAIEDKNNADYDKINETRDAYNAIRDGVKKSLLENRTKVLFLSATPFAYEKSIDYAEGYLFNYNSADGSGYNSGGGYEQFMMANFGGTMRYNKLTRAGAGVDTGYMQGDDKKSLSY